MILLRDNKIQNKVKEEKHVHTTTFFFVVLYFPPFKEYPDDDAVSYY